jgi:hypothetical protein
MTTHLRRNAVAYLALFVALGGTSYAAITLPANSVGARQIKRNAVSSPKVKDKSLKLRDFAAATRAALTGPAGPTGADGPTGPTGPAGPSEATSVFNGADQPIAASNTAILATLTLPSGDYQFLAKSSLHTNSGTGFSTCKVWEGEVQVSTASSATLSTTDTTLTVFWTHHHDASRGDMTLRCGTGVQAGAASETEFSAIRLGSLTKTPDGT